MTTNEKGTFIQLKLSQEINTKVEVYQALHNLETKADAILMMLSEIEVKVKV